VDPKTRDPLVGPEQEGVEQRSGRRVRRVAEQDQALPSVLVEAGDPVAGDKGVGESLDLQGVAAQPLGQAQQVQAALSAAPRRRQFEKRQPGTAGRLTMCICRLGA